ncbi:hypothetical protein D9603_17480 [Pseudoalteromonas sp. PS5]|nr:hypothetical protein D9603_17480 [Pseudoalteromonas sp. PS5]
MIKTRRMRILSLLFVPLISLANGLKMQDMKTVNYRDAVSFQIPANWKVEDELGVQGTFYEDLPNTGTLRISVFEFASNSEDERNTKIKDTLLPGTVETLAKGVYLKKATLLGEEEGEKLSLYRWLVALALPENLFRVVIFTHTIVEGQESDPKIKRELDLIDASVRNAHYSYSTKLEFVDKP